VFFFILIEQEVLEVFRTGTMEDTTVKDETLRRKGNWRFILTIVVLCLIPWIAHFLLCQDFGLYDDDYAYVGYPTNMFDDRFMGYPTEWDWSTLATYIKSNFMHWPQGRPIGLLFQGFYIAGSETGWITRDLCIWVLICGPQYDLNVPVAQRVVAEVAAMIGALAFCLFLPTLPRCC
jgi:hypothetical protein